MVTPPNQTLFRELIGRVVADINGNPVFQQNISNNLILKNGFVAASGKGEPCIYPDAYAS
jgi:hypothetical protein